MSGERLWSLVAVLDRLPRRLLLVANLTIGIFVLAAHGGALALVHLGMAPQIEDQRVTLYGSIAAAVGVVSTAVLGLARSAARERILALHAALFMPAAPLLLGWSALVLVKGPPADVNFSWAPGMLTGLVFYMVYLFRRQFLLGLAETSWLARSCHLWAGLLAAVVDLGVFARLLLGLFGRFG